MNKIELQYLEALTGRQALAQGAALCNECNFDFVVPRSAIEKGDEVAWGKTEEGTMK